MYSCDCWKLNDIFMHKIMRIYCQQKIHYDIHIISKYKLHVRVQSKLLKNKLQFKSDSFSCRPYKFIEHDKYSRNGFWERTQRVWSKFLTQLGQRKQLTPWGKLPKNCPKKMFHSLSRQYRLLNWTQSCELTNYISCICLTRSLKTNQNHLCISQAEGRHNAFPVHHISPILS